MSTRENRSRILITVGSLAMLVGAIDPMEGSLLVLPGSGLVALGAHLGQQEPRLVAYRIWVFALIAVGVGALWGLSMLGGFGGSSGTSAWWGVLILPYLIGWSMGVWGRGSPRWMLWLGMGIALWYLALSATILQRPARPGATLSAATGMVLAGIGVLTIGGCIHRLRKGNAE